MSNRRRKCEPNLTYHTFSRCINKCKMMKSDQMKDLMLKVLNLAIEKYQFEMLSYVIMDNHFHFFIRTVNTEITISKIMQFIKSQYAQRYNKLINRSGPFWNERFGDTIIEETDNPGFAFNYINTYINHNPVRAKYVSDCKKYKYGCINFYIDINYIPSVKLTYHKYFLNLGNTFQERAHNFLFFEEIYNEMRH